VVDRKELEKARNTCFRLLKFRPRSEYELRLYLKKKKFSHEVIEEVTRSFLNNGLIDDSVFAKLWIESRIKRPLGLRRIIFELKTKGISDDIINDATSKYGSSENEEKIVEELVSRKLKAMHGLDREKKKSRLWGLCLRKGFSKEVVYEVLNKSI